MSRRIHPKFIQGGAKLLFKFGGKLRPVLRKGRQLRFRYRRRIYKLRIRKGRIFVGRLRGRFKPFSHLVRRLKMFFHGYWHWVYPRRGLLNVYFRRKRRPFRVNNNGKPQLFYKNRWFGFGRRKVPLIMRLRYRNSWRAVVKRKGRWCIRVGAGYRKLILRGHRFGVRINGRWQYLQARNRLQIRFRNRWRWVRNCCNRLRAVLHGKLRRIRLRGGQAMYKTNNGKWRSIRSGSFRSVSFRLRRIRDQPLSDNSTQPMEQLNQSNPVDPSTLANTSAKPLVDDSPQTAADQEVPPESITNQMSKQAGETMAVNDNL